MYDKDNTIKNQKIKLEGMDNSPQTSVVFVDSVPSGNNIMAIISNGCIFLARKIQESGIWDKPSWWYKVFSHIIMEVSFNDKTNSRGTGFFQYHIIYKTCCLHKERGLKPHSISNLLRWMKKESICTTQTTTRGVYITLCNYSTYQNMSNYQNDTENDEKTTRERRENDTITKELKKERTKELKKEEERSIFPISEKAKQLEEEEKKKVFKEKKEQQKEIDVLEFWNFFLLKTKKRFKLTRDNRRLIEDRLKSYELVDLKKVVENFVNDKWERRAEYMDLIYCIGKQRGKPDTVEHWLNRPPKKSEVRYE